MKNLLTLFIFALALLAPQIGQGQFRQSWAKTFDGGLRYSDFTTNMAVDANGNIYVAGTVNNGINGATADIAVLKYSPEGEVLWYRTWDGPAANQDVAFGMALTPDASVVVVGRTNTPTTSSDYVTLKYGCSDGALLWSQTFDGPSHSIDEALAVAVDTSGNIFVTGEVWNDTEYYPNGDYATVKYAPNGNLLWSRLYDGPGNYIASSDQPHSIVLDSNGDVIVSGDSPDINNAGRIATVKYRGADGAELWALRTETIGISGYQAALDVAPNNDVILGLNSQDFGLQVVLVRLDTATGNPVWTIRDAFPHGGRLRHTRAMALDPSGNPCICVTYDPDVDNSNLNYNIQTTKYDFATGGRIWSVSVGNTNRYDGQGAGVVTTDAQGNVFVAGQNLVVPHTRMALWQFRAGDGLLQWATDYAFSSDSDQSERVLFDTSGNLIVAGQTVNNNNGFADMFVTKYAGISSLSGVVSLEGCAVVAGTSLSFGFRQPDGTPLFTRTATLGADGSFRLGDLPGQNYLVHVKGAKWLASNAAVNLSGGNVFNISLALRGGDANNDNAVDVLDLDLLIQAFDSVPGDANWNGGAADFNSDGSTDVLDLDLLVGNFDQVGDL